MMFSLSFGIHTLSLTCYYYTPTDSVSDSETLHFQMFGDDKKNNENEYLKGTTISSYVRLNNNLTYVI